MVEPSIGILLLGRLPRCLSLLQNSSLASNPKNLQRQLILIATWPTIPARIDHVDMLDLAVFNKLYTLNRLFESEIQPAGGADGR